MADYYYCVYILANDERRLYTGMTSNLRRRIYQHKRKDHPGFTKWFNITRLVYYESAADKATAKSREKQIKAWPKAKRIALIETVNPGWEDLSSTLTK